MNKRQRRKWQKQFQLKRAVYEAAKRAAVESLRSRFRVIYRAEFEKVVAALGLSADAIPPQFAPSRIWIDPLKDGE